MPVGDRRDPFRSSNFLVEMDGITRASFRECSGLDFTQDAIEYREGGDPNHTRKLTGMVKYSNITLRSGMTDDWELWEWKQQAADGKNARRNGSIVVMNERGDEVLRWNFEGAWPTQWTGPSLNAMGNEVAIETLVLAVERVQKA
ncbi:MAG: phage tail protein [Gemmatimonadetes bacterium]|nr:phage tail protein [Gemmatimonadota bacterium]